MAFQGEIYIKDGKIKELSEKVGFVKIIQNQNEAVFDNAFAFPGFKDHHGHIVGFGRSLSLINFSDCSSAEECCEMAVNSNKAFNEWIIGYGWNQEKWAETDLPRKEIIDKYFPDNPVYFVRVDGHSAWVNSKALELAGISSNPKNPEGGEILLDESGYPTGILIDNAMELVNSLIPKLSDNHIKTFIQIAVDQLIAYGITEVDDMDVDPNFIPLFKDLDSSNQLKIKVNSFVKAQNDEYLKNKITPKQFKNFNIKGIKFYSDGALGSYGAAMIKPYSDNKRSSGLLLISYEDLLEKSKKGIDLGFSIATHSIGDLANRLVIDVYSKLFEIFQNENIELRIEHAQIIHPEDLKKIGFLSDKGHRIIASVQPIHCISDANMARKRLGRRTRNSYLWKSLMEKGAKLIFGSDFPIESPDPLLGIDALINRIPFSETKSWLERETIDLLDALNGYQSDLFRNNYSSKQLNKNLPADITILDKNLFELNSKNIKSAKVVATFVNGNRVFLNPDYALEK
ncbi:MAG: amidohydrolase [Candidatus Kapabacteria bacterium]|nr:amidohydrolase [Candidatus Kapabacteria bacterium]